jgi:hypothetical protein
MPIHFSIGVAHGDEDRDQLDRHRSGLRGASANADPARRQAGWPVPSERSEDDAEPRLPAWAW